MGMNPMTYQFLTFDISALQTFLLAYQPGFWHISRRLAYQPGFWHISQDFGISPRHASDVWHIALVWNNGKRCGLIEYSTPACFVWYQDAGTKTLKVKHTNDSFFCFETLSLHGEDSCRYGGLGFARAATCANPESLGAMAGSSTHRWLRLGHSPDVKSPCGCPRQSLSSERGVVGSGAACRRRRPPMWQCSQRPGGYRRRNSLSGMRSKTSCSCITD